MRKHIANKLHRFHEVIEWKRQRDVDRRNRCIEAAKCPYCNASLKYAIPNCDKGWYVCSKCGGVMESSSGGAGAPGVIIAAGSTRMRLEMKEV